MSTRTLTTTLPSDTLYVSGTVNGVATVWTNTEGNTWQTVADRAGNDVYVVALTIINSFGNSSETTFTLYYGLHLVTDRTQADENRAEQLNAKGFDAMTEAERAEWLGGLKGAYNATDLNRVGAAVRYVADKLLSCGYLVEVSPKQDWTIEDIPAGEDMALYLRNVAALRSAIAVLPTTPDLPGSMENLDYIKANNIEKILEDLDALLINMASAWFYSGEIYSGEVN